MPRKLEDVLNGLVDAGVTTTFPEAEGLRRTINGHPYMAYPTPSGSVIFSDNDYRMLQDSLGEIRAHGKNLADTLDVRDVEERVIDFLGDRFRTKMHVDAAEAKAWLDEILDEPVQTFTVYRDLYGVNMADRRQRVVLGPFTVVHYPTHKASIVAPSAAMNQWEQGQGFEFAIGVSVRARTMARAQSKADELFAQFERVVRYFLGPAEHIEVGVLSYTGRASRRSMTVLDGGVAHLRHSNVGAFQPFRIDHPTLVCESYTRIWNLLGADRRLTSLEQRVVRAVEWVGEAAHESSIQSAFLKGAIALELLLVGKETKFVNASISARLAETVALLVGKTSEHRIELEEMTKDLYGKRSAVAHSGNSSVGWADVVRLFSIVQASVYALQGDETLRSKESIDHVLKLLRTRKYSFVGFEEASAAEQ